MSSWDTLRAGAAHVEVEDHLRASIDSGRKLRVKFGMDPTAPDIHLGHTVVLHKLRQFQELGHTAVLVIGDFTARIGDPSGRSETRPMLDEAAIETNLQTFRDQAFKVLHRDNFEERRQSEWFGHMNVADLIRLAQKATVGQLLQREDFSRRMTGGDSIGLHELLYPLLQGYDSVAVAADVELGGTDQLYNLLFARDVQRDSGMAPEDILTMPILEGLDGKQKMSKSLGNYIAVTDPPGEMFGKVMSIPDELIARYMTLVSGMAVEEITAIQAQLEAGGNPRDAKVQLARAIVERYHDAAAAQDAAGGFAAQFRDRSSMGEVVPVPLPESGPAAVTVFLATFAVSSRGEGRRLIAQGGVRLNGRVLADPEEIYEPRVGDLWQVGKRRAFVVSDASG